MSPEIQEFIAGYPAAVEEVSLSVRSLIVKVVPNCTETLHPGWKVISYGTDKKFCAIAPHSKWVNLQFYSGAVLSDRAGLLTGTGKSMRHVKLDPGKPIAEDVSDLILEAAELATRR